MEGINLHRHFCGGSIADVSLFNHLDEKECCGDKPCNECYDDHVTLKVNQEHVVKVGFDQLQSMTVEQELPAHSYTSPKLFHALITREVNCNYNVNYPHRVRDPLYVRHCSWLI